RGGRGLGLAFDAGEPGEARVALSRDGLERVSGWLPARPLRPAGDASRLRIGYAPGGEGLDALRAVFAIPSPLDHERLAQAGVPAAHPDWLLRATAAGPSAWDTRDAWGGKLYALDGAHPKVQQWLTELARLVVRDWGYDYLEIDALHCATAGPAHYGGLTHAEAYRAGLAALRDGLGTEAFLLGGGAPLQHAAGLVNGMRIGPDANPTWAGVQAAVRAAALRSFYHRASWLNDPACLAV